MSNIFISYSRHNKECVYAVVSEMEGKDYDCWIDKKSIELTTDWLEEIQSAIEEASVFILFLSKESVGSKFVQQEIEFAKPRVADKSLKALMVRLDGTDLPHAFSHLQAYDMQNGCSSLEVDRLISYLDDSWRSFSKSKKLSEQPHRPVADTPFISVPFAISPKKSCRAYIVGQPDATLSSTPTKLIIALQFTQPKNNNMIASIHKSLNKPDAQILHITGPDSVNPRHKNGYGMDDTNPAQWLETVTFINECITEIATSASTTLQFFSLTPNALFGAVCTEYGRFWASEFFNWTGDATNPYQSVIILNRNR